MDTNITYIDAEIINDKLRSVLLPVTIYVGFEAVLGFFGNLLVLFVFTFRYHSCNFRYFVLCLALTDVIACCTAVSGEVVTQTFWYIYPFHQICKAKSFFNVFTVFAEAFCLLTIAVDRYRKVCAPLGWQITPRIAITICVVIYILSGIIAIPVAIFWGTHGRVANKSDLYLNEIYFETVRVNVSICEIDKGYLRDEDPELYTNCLETILSLLLVPMLILYILIARSLIKRANSRLRSEIRNDVRVGQKPRIGARSAANTKNIQEGSQIDSNTSFDQQSSTPGEVYSKSYEKDCVRSDAMPSTNVENKEPVEIVTQSKEKVSRKSGNQKNKMRSRVHRKTRIMFILTFIFIFTTVAYLVMLEMIADHILETLSDPDKAAYFFGFRFYFLNHVINPVVYGFLDPQFRKAMRHMSEKLRSCFSRCIVIKH